MNNPGDEQLGETGLQFIHVLVKPHYSFKINSMQFFLLDKHGKILAKHDFKYNLSVTNNFKSFKKTYIRYRSQKFTSPWTGD